jgi:hypothetical protein
MKTLFHKSYFFSALMAAMVIGLGACRDDDTTPNEFTGEVKTYALNEVGTSGVSGEARFEERNDGTTRITLNLSGTPQGGQHPAHIHLNSASEGGAIAISLEPVEGNNGRSETIVTAQDNGSPITYNQLLDFDGHINVHLSADDLETLVAAADIGSNELTGESKTYVLNPRDVEGISGEVIFRQRRGGHTMAEINLENTPEGGTHPAHIHNNSVAEGGGIYTSLNPVDGNVGRSFTTIREDDAGNAISYEDIVVFDGHVNVHLSPDQLDVIVAQGDIGANELTGESVTYPLATAQVDGISGEITFAERLGGHSLATIQLTGTPAGGSHPAHIHANSAAEGGGILVTFTPVNGDTGRSVTTVRELDDDGALTYAQILEMDGHVNVHLSESDLATIVAQGDIGANSP